MLIGQKKKKKKDNIECRVPSFRQPCLKKGSIKPLGAPMDMAAMYNLEGKILS
jgi:hypothetical protein